MTNCPALSFPLRYTARGIFNNVNFRRYIKKTTSRTRLGKEYPQGQRLIRRKDLQKYPMQATSYHAPTTKLFDWIHLTCLLFPIEKARSVLLLPITLFEFVEV